jgi:hypothetical protein
MNFSHPLVRSLCFGKKLGVYFCVATAGAADWGEVAQAPSVAAPLTTAAPLMKLRLDVGLGCDMLFNLCFRNCLILSISLNPYRLFGDYNYVSREFAMKLNEGGFTLPKLQGAMVRILRNLHPFFASKSQHKTI